MVETKRKFQRYNEPLYHKLDFKGFNEYPNILKLISAERQKLLFRQKELIQEEADIEIKIAGLNYVDEMIESLTK